MHAAKSFVLAALFSSAIHSAPPLDFLPVERMENGAILLRLGAIPGSNYVIEASQHLKYWYPVSSGPASAASYDFIVQPTNSALFHRARFQRTNAPPRLTPQVDAQWSASGLATVDGGSCFLTVPGPITYRLIVPPRALRDPTVITMTLVTNIVEWPFTNSIDAVVRLEPDGLEFSGVATLEIEFPTNVPPGALSSYTFDGNGEGVHLLAAQVESNRVTIPLTHFSFAGAGTLPSSTTSATATDAYNAQVNEVSNRIAEQLKSNPDLATDPDFWSDVQADFENLLNKEIGPLLPKVSTDCTVGEKVVTAVNQARRQFEIISIIAGEMRPIMPDFDERLCGIYANCKKELKEQCLRIGGRGSLAIALTKLSRQGALFGLGPECGASDMFSEVKPCAALWYGDITYTETGSTNHSGFQTRYSQNRSFKVSGYVEHATELARDGFLVLSLDIVCTYAGTETMEASSESTNIAKDQWSTHISSTLTNQLSFVLMPGFEPTFTMEFPEVPKITSRTGSHCAEGGKCITILEKSTNTFSPGSLSKRGAETGWVPPDRFSGTSKREVNPGGGNAPLTMTFTWNFQRNDEYQPPTP